MRMTLTLIAVLALCSLASAQDDLKKKMHRYGFDVDEITYPQKTPAEAMTLDCQGGR